MSEIVNERRSPVKGVVGAVILLIASLGLAWLGFANAEQQEVVAAVIGLAAILGSGLALAGAVVTAVSAFSTPERRPRRLSVTSLVLAAAAWLVFWVLAPWIVPSLELAMPSITSAMTSYLGFGLIGAAVALGAATLAIVALVERWGRALPIAALAVVFVPPLFLVLTQVLFAAQMSTTPIGP